MLADCLPLFLGALCWLLLSLSLALPVSQSLLSLCASFSVFLGSLSLSIFLCLCVLCVHGSSWLSLCAWQLHASTDVPMSTEHGGPPF